MLEPDIVFYFGVGYAIETDITVVNPTAPSYVARSTYPVKGNALASAEQRKKNKYEERANMRGRQFLPLGFETHGIVGPGVLNTTPTTGNTDRPWHWTGSARHDP